VSPRARRWLFLVSAAVFGVVLVATFARLPSFGDYHGVYGFALNYLDLPQRAATDVVTAVNFDYRAFDTLGEEFILFAAVLGLAVLLRESRGERKRPPGELDEERRLPRPSSALRALSLGLVGPTIVLGIYVIIHGQLTPGGGFQGGVVFAAAALIAFLGGEYVAMKAIAPHAFVEFTEGAMGAAAYGLIGLGGLVFASYFFQNFIGLGEPGKLLSAGTIPLNSTAVGIEVAGAFLLLWSEFLDQALLVRGT
jgi:multicomponent Na+:H+ antiporter subunit B